MTFSSSKKNRPKGTTTNLELVPDSAILIAARVKAGTSLFSYKQIANLVMHDPVLTLEFLQFANSLLYAGASADVYSAETAVTRIGIERVLQILAEMNRRARFESERASAWFESVRFDCRRTSIVSMILAAAIRPSMSEAARTAGLFCYLGHMLAILELGERYADLADKYKRAMLVHRLQKDCNFNIDAALAKFLQSKGIPERLTVAFTLDQECENSDQADFRFLVQSAKEMIEAWDDRKFENYGPDGKLPVRSSFRLLKIPFGQHEKLFAMTKQYLKNMETEEAPETASFLIGDLDDDQTQRGVEEDSDGTSGSRYSLQIPEYPAQAVSAKNQERLQGLYAFCDSLGDENQLSQQLPAKLIEVGLFERVALMTIDPEEGDALITKASGKGISEGQSFKIKDPLSPFNLFTLKIKSFNSKKQQPASPFGVSAFAIGPVANLKGGRKLVLYADRGQEDCLTMDSRRTFRLVLNLLSDTVKKLRVKDAET